MPLVMRPFALPGHSGLRPILSCLDPALPPELSILFAHEFVTINHAGYASLLLQRCFPLASLAVGVVPGTDHAALAADLHVLFCSDKFGRQRDIELNR